MWIYKIYKLIAKTIDNLFNQFSFFIQKVKYPPSLKVEGKVFLRNRGKITIGHDVTINSSLKANPITGDSKTILYTVDESSNITIGNYVGLSNCVIHSKSDIFIEDYVFIGCGTKIYDHDFHSISLIDRINEIKNGISNEKSNPITIKKGAFIGSNVMILKGVIIGESSIIGAGSVVTKNIPPKEIWGGNPAKFLREIR